MMNFKEALIAHLQGEVVEVRKVVGGTIWVPFMQRFGHVDMCYADSETAGASSEFRTKPRPVMCNGVEVPAPESVAPSYGTEYWLPAPLSTGIAKVSKDVWHGDMPDTFYLDKGLVYLREEDADARAKAMLITNVAS